MSEGASIGFLDPGKILDRLKLREGDTIADFGCGGGHFSLEAARRVGEQGIVWAFDVLPSALEAIKSASEMEGLKHIMPKHVNLEKEKGSDLEDKTVDVVIAKDILFQNKDKKKILCEAHRILKNDGRLLVIEWGEKKNIPGPDATLRVAREALEALLAECEFGVVETLSAGDYHYAFIVCKA